MSAVRCGDNIIHQSRAVFTCSCDKTRCRDGKKRCWQRLAATPHARQLWGMFRAPTSAVPRLAYVQMRVGYLQMQVCYLSTDSQLWQLENVAPLAGAPQPRGLGGAHWAGL